MGYRNVELKLFLSMSRKRRKSFMVTRRLSELTRSSILIDCFPVVPVTRYLLRIEARKLTTSSSFDFGGIHHFASVCAAHVDVR